MEKSLKLKLLLFGIISAVSFIYLVLPEKAGVSVPIFTIIQFAFLYFISPKKKPLWMFVPIFILTVNNFISGNPMWRVTNFLVIIVLYSVMILMMTDRFPIKELSNRYITNTFVNIFMPIKYFALPFKWVGKVNEDRAKIIKRVIISIVITVPCILFLIIMLSFADTIFFNNTIDFLDYIFRMINPNAVFKGIYGGFVGLYLFGLIYITYTPKKEDKVFEAKERQGDSIILNILLISILAIYTMFVAIQFRYLFAGGDLPYGLTFTEYARKGFFELLFLSGLNILLILITVNFNKSKIGHWAKVTKSLCLYLCAVTIVMLVSSFYRMWLYNSDDGLTRLRLLVFGFLIFEAIGLLITFAYIIKPKFNIVAIYLSIALIYYLMLNIVPIDYVIAKNQVDRFFNKQNDGITYTTTLSTDAAPQIARLIDSDDVDESTKDKARSYFNKVQSDNNMTSRWQRYNISIQEALNLGNNSSI